ncbi:MAG TPA: 2,3-bisphosphoglycerate-independent phosphoglycerate mutase, partial [Clostridiaceae bacterium]|nr:2,3-bisphosphoglycerate-independent phosphoglycerate mutase [Clostridiaceae bacterium]
MTRRPLLLMILDGWGLSERSEGNAVKAAKTPNLDSLAQNWPTTLIRTSGEDVGLPAGQMGNSEVGHMNIGAGRIVYQELTRISKDMASGEYLSNPAFLTAIENAKSSGGALHLLGLLSDGGVHSHIEHLYGLLEMAAHHDVEEVYVHAIYDGRDVSPHSGLGFTKELLRVMDKIGRGRLATISGRYYAMDRDRRWERVERAYLALVRGSDRTTSDPISYIEKSYEENITDEFLLPATIVSNGNPVGLIKPRDSVIFFNFRPDRARELTRSFMQPDFSEFKLPRGHFPLCFVTMTDYDKTFHDYPGLLIAYAQEMIEKTLGQYIAELGLRQLRIAETEKYAHVTFFFNGGVEQEYPGEDRILIASPKVATYDLQPEMSAPEVTEEVLRRLDTDRYDVIILNYANCDMVGHTG